MANDPYSTLGVDKKATAEEIKRAYRRLVLIFHPDNASDATDAERKVRSEKWNEVSEAYAILGDSERRSMFDSIGLVTPIDTLVDSAVTEFWSSARNSFHIGKKSIPALALVECQTRILSAINERALLEESLTDMQSDLGSIKFDGEDLAERDPVRLLMLRSIEEIESRVTKAGIVIDVMNLAKNRLSKYSMTKQLSIEE